MDWFKRIKEGITTKTSQKKETADGLWVKCPKCKTITSKDDLINNLGTIASSGTKRFISNMTNNVAIDQIGQFGVGFYSSFLVADNVTIYTKHNDECEYIWQSNASKSFTITKNKKPILKRGTRIILEIKEEEDEYLDIAIVKSVIKKYMQFINFPIELKELKDNEEDEYIWNIINKIEHVTTHIKNNIQQ